MKKVILSTLFLVIALISFSQVYVNGYYRSNGTYVKPHYRSNPDGIIENNWSYPGNVNPYTGRIGGTNRYVGESYTPTYIPTSTNSHINTSIPSSTRTTYPSIYSSGSTSGSSSGHSNFKKSTYTSTTKSFKSSSTVSVTASTLNVRSLPSTNGEVLCQLKNGERLIVVNQINDEWVGVKFLVYNDFYKEYKYKYGYVSSKFIN